MQFQMVIEMHHLKSLARSLRFILPSLAEGSNEQFAYATHLRSAPSRLVSDSRRCKASRLLHVLATRNGKAV